MLFAIIGRCTLYPSGGQQFQLKKSLAEPMPAVIVNYVLGLCVVLEYNPRSIKCPSSHLKSLDRSRGGRGSVEYRDPSTALPRFYWPASSAPPRSRRSFIADTPVNLPVSRPQRRRSAPATTLGLNRVLCVYHPSRTGAYGNYPLELRAS